MTAMRIGRLATVLILCGAWLAAAYLLWRTSVPASIRVGGLDQHRYFTAIELARASKYERFTDILWVAQVAATIVALLVLTRRSPRLASSIGLGPVGTGVIVGMVMLVTLWFVRLPFGFLSQWWDARHGLAPHDYVSWIFAPWAQVLSEAVFGLVTIVIVMGLAGKLGNRWWIAGALALTVANLVTAPVRNYVSRRYEAEADWSALNATNDPASGRKLFVDFQRTSLERPDPPTWAYLWLADHPTLGQRVAMVEDFARG